MQGKMPRKKIHAKKKVKKKNSCRKSESQKSTILPGDKQKSFSSY